MQLLAKAFGWPEFSGTLAASIPGVTLKDNVLTFEGNVESQVFGGRIVGSNIRLQDPLGRFPQFFADVRARDLDLGLLTQTFEVGSITGRLEVDVLGLELFDWSPTAFDARLATPKGDKSRHRISAKAVSSLSNVGGGGGGVVQALQSGVLRFFDEYSYDKLGITCKLRRRRLRDVGHRTRRRGLLHRQGRGTAAHRHRRQPGARQLESAAVVDLHRGVRRRHRELTHGCRWTPRPFGRIIARTFDVRHVQGSFIAHARSCPRPGLRLE